MKKKIVSNTTLKVLRYLSTILLVILWGLSITMTFYLLTIFGWKFNHPYRKDKEKTYRKKLDILYHAIIAIWCLLSMINLILYGPFLTLYYFAQNIVYIVLTFVIMKIWLNRDYHNHQSSRNLLILVSLWNSIMYVITALLIFSTNSHSKVSVDPYF